MIEWEDFDKIEFRVGTVLTADVLAGARKPAYKLNLWFGEEIGTKQSSAQITDLYTSEELVGKQVICVVNFPPKRIGKFVSECLVTGLYREDGAVVLAVPDKAVANGIKLG
jgi:tRNA-binding protein